MNYAEALAEIGVAPHSEVCVWTTEERFALLRVVKVFDDGNRIQLAVRVWADPRIVSIHITRQPAIVALTCRASL